MSRFEPPTATNTRPEQIIDKNGILTTRHKKVNTSSVSRSGSVPVLSLSAGATRPLADNTPSEVDIPLSENYYKQSQVGRQMMIVDSTVQDYERIIQDRIERSQRTFARLTEEGNSERAALFADPEKDYEVVRYRQRVIEQQAKLPGLQEQLDELVDEASVYEDEFSARGGWSRFYQVTNSNGHVHKSTQCSTCFPSTQFHWHADRSGMSNEGIVDLAGSDACTVCFPDAPVEKLSQPGSLETPDMKTKREEREERERKRAEKAIATEAKDISNSDGSPLRTQNYGTIKTERAAEQDLVSSLLWLYQRDEDHYDGNPYVIKYEQDSQTIFEALLAKRGGDREEQINLIKEKAIAKLKREWKGAIPTFERKFNAELLR